jgi:hypothetical protein
MQSHAIVLKVQQMKAIPTQSVESGRAAEAAPLISIRSALDLLATAVSQGEERLDDAAVDQPQDVVRYALSLAPVDDDDLAALGCKLVREVYADGRLRDRLTLGALVVFDAAEKSQIRGRSPSVMLGDATRAAGRFAELIPDAALDVRASHGSLATRDIGAAGIPAES